MKAIEFVNNYQQYLEEISQVIKPELQPVLDELRQIDPHDLVRPDSWFQSESEAKGFVWKMFIKRVKNITQQNNHLLQSQTIIHIQDFPFTNTEIPFR